MTERRFADFRLLPNEKELLSSSVEGPMTSRASSLFLALVEGGVRLVSKEELMQRVWAGIALAWRWVCGGRGASGSVPAAHSPFFRRDDDLMAPKAA